MGLKSWFSKLFAKRVVQKMYDDAAMAVQHQEQILSYLVDKGVKTEFGRDHHFHAIKSHTDFTQKIPVRDYEGLRNYFDRVVKGETSVLWPGQPVYLSKTSGTTSGAKYIPITKESIPEHISAARNALLSYINNTGNAAFVDGKMIFLQGSPVLDNSKAIPTGRLSGIVAHHVPGYLQKNRMPSFEVNCIEDWETKVDAIVEETLKEDMRLISGIPAWVQMYFEKLIEKTGKKTVAEIFPNFSLLVYGGVNFEPYAARFRELIGKEMPTVELFPASEGFFAFQDRQDDTGLLLNTNAGMYYEFVPQEELDKPHPKTLSLSEVELNVNYALVISSNAGLWRYNIGDLVKFTSLSPFKIRVTGRIKHYTSAFGEHVIAEEVEGALSETLKKDVAAVTEFTLAPQITPESGLPYHEWFIEFNREPKDWNVFIENLDTALQNKNPYYRDLIEGKVLSPLKITLVEKDGFQEFMKKRGKLGGQNKIPRLANDRKIADELKAWSVKTIASSNF
ncbi:GH3 auxin-responsive promoter family protein [Luteibaculum oceani]|uniref:GH3 auxin-responsive promoter family protein n=1 Tax=Luteibaculum oceani TaxID=1294296 RepID=A0A5C6VK05_9FLAO|nr:GH3 auxin-responsive promoter family protein [Luteibaculum oceani]TXC85279.1 GH3 auxin-responsive promoter family protein [Luteibaculum oceani]